MTTPVLDPLDLERKNGRLIGYAVENTGSLPGDPGGTAARGLLMVDTADGNKLKVWNGAAWEIVTISTHTHAHGDAEHALVELNDLAAPDGPVDLGTQRATNAGAATADTDLLTLGQARDLVRVIDRKDSVRVATAAALPAYTRTGNVITASANGALAAVDGVTLAVNESLLVNHGAAGADNGIYTVTQVGTGGTPYILTRRVDADISAEVTAGMTTYVEEGTANADKRAVLTTNNPITLNTTALTFVLEATGESITAGTGLTKTGSTVDAVAGATPGTGGPGGGLVANANDLVVDTDVVARRKAFNNTSGTSAAYTHNLGHKDVLVQVRRISDDVVVQAGVVATSTTQVTVSFAESQSANTFRIIVIG